jgi:hypothetical protein
LKPTSEPSHTRLATALWSTTAIVCALGLYVELAAGYGWLDPLSSFRSGLSLSYEGNVPTWYASGLLWTAALGLGHCAHREPGRERWWWGLAAIFMLFSLDEAIELHEGLDAGAERNGILYFSWVVPAATATFAFVAVYAWFWLRLPAPTRRGFAWAFVLYVGGALGMELPLGAWYEAHGDENLGYGVLDFVEESLELVGLSVFLLAIARHLRSLAVTARE